MASAAAAAIHRRLTTSRAHHVQPRAGAASRRSRGQSRRRPSPASIAGSTVRLASTLINGTSMLPIANAADERHREHNDYDQSKRYRSAAEHDRPPGCSHGDADRSFVVVPVRYRFSPPADEQQ